MIFSKEGNTSILTQERASIPELVDSINQAYKKIKHDNIIVNLSSLGTITTEEIVEFLKISITHRAAKHSFVLVNSSIDVDKTPDEIVVVPTLQEAFDIIEMEEMERDLGF
jgi:hypothetical protein